MASSLERRWANPQEVDDAENDKNIRSIALCASAESPLSRGRPCLVGTGNPRPMVCRLVYHTPSQKAHVYSPTILQDVFALCDEGG